MDPHLLLHIDHLIHEAYMVALREELHFYSSIAAQCRVWVKTLLYTRHWNIASHRSFCYHLLSLACLHPVHRRCYDRIIFLVKMTTTLQSLSPQRLNTTYLHTDIPMLLLI